LLALLWLINLPLIIFGSGSFVLTFDCNRSAVVFGRWEHKMNQVSYIIWAIAIVFLTTMINLSSDNSSGSSRSWSSNSGSGWSSGGGHK
jgi:uncharacterized membrane protein YgcG